MTEPLQVSISEWGHILMGHSNQPVSSKELTDRAKAGEVIVVDEFTGEQYRPVIVSDYGDGAGTWTLQKI